MNGIIKSSNSTIDLIFLSDQLDTRFQKFSILKTTPSDHYLVQVDLKVDVPKVYTLKESHRDPTRRPAIRSDKLAQASQELDSLINSDSDWDTLTHSQVLSRLCFHMTTVLNKYARLNKPGLATKKIYRFVMSKECRQIKRRKFVLLKKLRKAQKCKDSLRINELSEKLEIITRDERRISRNDRTSYYRNMYSDKLDSSKNIWKFINRTRPSKKVDSSKIELEIDGLRGDDLVNDIASYLYDRAHLVSDSDVSNHNIPWDQIHIPKNAATFSSMSTDYDPLKLFAPKKGYTSLACGPDAISHRHIHDFMPVIKDKLKLATTLPIDTFLNIESNYTRTIPKPPEKEDKNNDKPGVERNKLTKKSMRPIAETNVITKYCSVRIFMDNFRR